VLEEYIPKVKKFDIDINVQRQKKKEELIKNREKEVTQINYDPKSKSITKQVVCPALQYNAPTKLDINQFDQLFNEKNFNESIVTLGNKKKKDGDEIKTSNELKKMNDKKNDKRSLDHFIESVMEHD
jgi:hypothetical protein